jgi:hypothetical protein
MLFATVELPCTGETLAVVEGEACKSHSEHLLHPLN